MFNRKSLLALCGAIVGVAVAVAAVQAQTSDRRTTYLTFSGPVSLPGVTLSAGTYLFEVPEPLMSADIVRVTNRSHTIVYLTAFTNRVDRPARLRGDVAVTFGEAGPGTAKPIAVWYPMGETLGHEFQYHR